MTDSQTAGETVRAECRDCGGSEWYTPAVANADDPFRSAEQARKGHVAREGCPFDRTAIMHSIAADRIADTAANAHEEWDYIPAEQSDSDFGTPMATAVPCQLRFTAPPGQDTERFHAVLERHGYLDLDPNPTGRRETSQVAYDGEVCDSEQYHRIRVNVAGQRVRLFPHDGYVPDIDGLAALLGALEIGFDAPLEHDPIEQEADVA